MPHHANEWKITGKKTKGRLAVTIDAAMLSTSRFWFLGILLRDKILHHLGAVNYCKS